jgi:hypothetical protein
MRGVHRTRTGGPTAVDALSPRWQGQPGRLEVWYASVSDPATGTGYWIHHETVAPVTGAPFAQGWFVMFPAGSAPVLERFGPEPLPAVRAAGTPWATSAAVFDPPVLRGGAGRLQWDLKWTAVHGAKPLFTFPAWVWQNDVFPSAAVVPVAHASFAGTVRVHGTEHLLSAHAHGGIGHVYGHGNAERWGWLHAELGGGDVLEIVSAVSRRPGLRRLPPLAFVQLRVDGNDWPRHPLVAAPFFRTRFAPPEWHVQGVLGRWRLTVRVTLPASDVVSVRYADPDGATATCTNSEVADADITLELRRGGWEVDRTWRLAGTAHAEVGLRP